MGNAKDYRRDVERIFGSLEADYDQKKKNKPGLS
jgi:hypothetical protein